MQGFRGRSLIITVTTTLLLTVVAGAMPALAASATRGMNVVVTAGAAGGTGAANGIPDEFRLVRKGPTLEVYLEGTLSQSLPFEELKTLTVNGSTDNDTLTVDFSGGNPIPSAGLVYNGREGLDTLRLAGGAVEKIAYTYSSPTDGVLNIDGSTLTFTGLEPVLDLVSGPLVVNGTNANNAITYTQGSVAANGLVAIDNLETIEFSNKTSLVINGLFGNDDIVLDNPSVPTGLISITVNGDLGNDVITVAGGAPVAITINGDEGDDVCKIVPSATSVITCNGGAHVVGDALLVPLDSNKADATDTGAAVVVSGFADVAYSGVERIDIVTPKKATKILSPFPRGK